MSVEESCDAPPMVEPSSLRELGAKASSDSMSFRVLSSFGVFSFGVC